MSAHPESRRLKLSAVVDCYRNGERSRTGYLVELGRLCREYVEMAVEGVRDAGRRRELRAEATKELHEALIDECGGTPQVNRWIKFAVLCEWYPAAAELPQGTLTHLIRWVDRDSQSETWGEKWRDEVTEGEDTPLCEVVNAAVEDELTASDVRELMDLAEKEFTGVNEECEIKSKLAQEKPCESSPASAVKPSTSSTSTPTRSSATLSGSSHSTNASPKSSGTSAASKASTSTPASSTQTASPSSKPSSEPTQRPSDCSPQSSANSRQNSATSSTSYPKQSTHCETSDERLTGVDDPQVLGLQILNMLKDEQILAATFRRIFDGDQIGILSAIVENMIRADAKQNIRALGKAYNKLKPTVLTFCAEALDEHENLRLKMKDVPSAPGAEELAPGAMAKA